VILARLLADDVLLQARQRAEGIDAAVAHVELALGDVAGVVRHRVRHVAARHGRHRQDGHRAGAGKHRRLLVTPRQLRIEIAQVAARRGHAVQRDADFLERVRVGRHVGHQHQHALLLVDRELLGDRQHHVRDQQPLERRVRGLVDEHHGALEDALVLEGRRKR
jgi:hypothetical protein